MSQSSPAAELFVVPADGGEDVGAHEARALHAGDPDIRLPLERLDRRPEVLRHVALVEDDCGHSVALTTRGSLGKQA